MPLTDEARKKPEPDVKDVGPDIGYLGTSIFGPVQITAILAE
jgi:hypothetical protein